MTDTPKAKPNFFREDGARLILYLDASLCKDFMTCPQYFKYKHVDLLRVKPIAGLYRAPFAMMVGSWWSGVMEALYDNMGEGKIPPNPMNLALKVWSDLEMDKIVETNPDAFDKFGNAAGGALMLSEYMQSQYEIDKRAWKIIGTEAGFGYGEEVLLYESEKLVVYWVGKPDLIAIEGDRLVPIDHKTVDRIDGRVLDRYKPSIQMSGYCFALEHIAKTIGIDRRVGRCTVNICARSRPSEKPRDGKIKPRFIRAYPTFNSEEILEWKRQVGYIAEDIGRCLRVNEWMWRSTSCHNMYFRDCEYLKIDRQPESVRPIIIKADYMLGTPWKPYQKEKDDEGED